MPSVLAIPSRPLIDHDKRLVVLWSPKCACTTAYVWFASVCGFVDEVRQYSAAPHDHRLAVYNPRANHPTIQPSDVADYFTLKIIRDPYQRAVSIFRHALVNGLADPELDGLRDTGISFRQFLDIAATRDMAACDPHLRPQMHPYERMRAPDRTINISRQDLFRELNTVERERNYLVTNFARMQWLHDHEAARRLPSQRAIADDTTPLNRREHLNTFPDYTQLLTENNRHMIEHIHAVDFEAYAAQL